MPTNGTRWPERLGRTRRLKAEVYEALEGTSPLGKWTNASLLALIMGAVGASAFEIHLVRVFDKQPIRVFDTVCVLVFTVEYLLRIWSCDSARQSNPRVIHGWRDGLRMRVRHACRPMMVVDAIAVLPFYLRFVLPGVGVSLTWLRFLRVFRVFRIFKLSRYSAALGALAGVVRSRRRELLVLSLVAIVVIFIAANLLWEIEGIHEGVANEDQNPQVGSMAQSIWWTVVTITSTGYGDVVPNTLAGRVLAAGVMFLGVGLVAVPAGLVGATLLDMVDKMKSEQWKTGNYDGHVILCGWNPSAETITRELEAAEYSKIVVISREALPEEISARYPIIREDFTKSSVLKNVVYRESTWTHPCFIVLAEQSAGQTAEDVDARTMMTTMLAERIARENKPEHTGDPLYTITQMLDEENANALRESVATANEVFVSGQVIGNMIANSVLAAGSSDVLQELFSSAGENQLFSVAVGSLAAWNDAGIMYSEADDALRGQRAIPIGIATGRVGNKHPILNPRGDVRLSHRDDVVYYISRRRLY